MEAAFDGGTDESRFRTAPTAYVGTSSRNESLGMLRRKSCFADFGKYILGTLQC